MAIDADKKIFAKEWRTRFDEISGEHGEKSDIAAACGIKLASVSVWGQVQAKKRKKGGEIVVDDTLSLPDIRQSEKAARAKGFSPAYLAWGLTPKSAGAFDWALELGRILETVPETQRQKFIETAKTLSGLDFAVSAPATLKPKAAKTAAATTLSKPKLTPLPKRTPINRRHELKIYHATTMDDAKGVKVPRWLNLAAGDGCDLELCDDYKYFRELPDWKGVHSAVVRGESMLETLEPGDVIIMQELDSGTLELPQIESKEEKESLAGFMQKAKLKHNDICILSINDDPPTLKRIKFDTRRGRDWKLQIVADNEEAWGPTFQVSLGDKIVFHAKLIGLEGRGDDKSKYRVST